MIDPLRLHQSDALFLGRITYTGLILLFFPLKSPRLLNALGEGHFHPPPGPFDLFESYPPPWLINSVECMAFLFFALWVAGWGKWIVGTGLTLCLTFTSGFFYSAGKIDHDFVVLLLPVFLTLPGVTPKRALLFCLAVYFASSGIAKAAGGWLDLNTQASLSWALTYSHAYGKTELLLAWSLTNLPGWSWEILDQLTVWFELCVPLALLPPLRHWIALTIPLFHLFTVLLFGIDFARLALLCQSIANASRHFPPYPEHACLSLLHRIAPRLPLSVVPRKLLEPVVPGRSPGPSSLSSPGVIAGHRAGSSSSNPFREALPFPLIQPPACPCPSAIPARQ